MARQEEAQVKTRKHYVTIPSNYIEDLQQTGKRDKARAFMEYYFDMHNETVNSVRFYGKSWGKSVGTVNSWIKDFKHEIDRYFSYWMIQNDSHHTSVANTTEQKLNTTKNTTEQLNTNKTPTVSELSKTQLNTTKNTTEQKLNKDSNKNLININVENDSTNASSKSKTIYPKNFSILWNLYDVKQSNKKRALTIFQKRWKHTDLELLEIAIKKAKEEMTPGYEKHFDGFLNGVIDSYLPQRAWFKDAKGITHQGLYHESENKFVSDKGQEVPLNAELVSKLMKNDYFGIKED
ncbi:hypothetical protein [Arcobacter roscoffensis]|uniref:Uncharacterized protein n=1 Tax=Arcobacter roscoffensis TaxID=2961520 RepID=A0ABY5E2Y1_9BACT|nr:hypothetical protein [Arcobacter roscoffensis]UTJ05403.1 hypothetical protein NJU99_08990 [Arcobacter roscoffensis]